MAFNIDAPQWEDLLATLHESGPDLQYLNRIPREVRELSEARRDAQVGAEVESRNRINRNFDALGAGVKYLPRPDASRDSLKFFLRAQGAEQRAASAKAMEERVDTYGTAERWQARIRASEMLDAGTREKATRGAEKGRQRAARDLQQQTDTRLVAEQEIERQYAAREKAAAKLAAAKPEPVPAPIPPELLAPHAEDDESTARQRIVDWILGRE